MKFLTITEELFLLTIDPQGEALVINRRALNQMLATAVLMDLAVARKIDCDLKNIIPDDATPTGDVFADELLAEIHQSPVLYEIPYWIQKVLDRIDELKERITLSLVKKGVLRSENGRIMWFFSTRKYPMIQDQQKTDVLTRVRQTIFSQDLPELDDIVIISLLYHCDLLDLAFSEEEVTQHMVRIQQIAMMDLIGQAISRSISRSIARGLLGAKPPREELADYISEIQAKFKISKEEDLPEWMRKGTAQFEKTLEYVDQVGTGYVIYNKKTDRYQVLRFAGQWHLFGSGQ